MKFEIPDAGLSRRTRRLMEKTARRYVKKTLEPAWDELARLPKEDLVRLWDELEGATGRYNKGVALVAHMSAQSVVGAILASRHGWEAPKAFSL